MTSRWDALEVLEHIFSFLTPGCVVDLLACELVCHRWRHVLLRSRDAWKRVQFVEHTFLTRDDDGGGDDGDDSHDEIAKRSRKASTLTVRTLRALLARHAGKVQRLLVGAPITLAGDDWLDAMRLAAAELRDLTLAAPAVLPAKAQNSLLLLTRLERVNVSRLHTTNAIIKNFLNTRTAPHLLALNLSGISGIFASGVSMAAIRMMTALESLHFDSSQLTLVEICIPLVSTAYSLKHFSARNNLELDVLQYMFECTCTRLETLELSNTHLDNTALLSMLAAARTSLRVLDVSQTHVTSTIWAVCPVLPRLETLVIAKTRIDEPDWCESLLFRAPALKAIDVSFVAGVSDSDIALLEGRAERIVADGCRGVSRSKRTALRAQST